MRAQRMKPIWMGGVLVGALSGVFAEAGCKSRAMHTPPTPERAPTIAEAFESSAAARTTMVREQIAARGIEDKAVLAAMEAVPRHRFVPPALAGRAYEDRPLPIGFDQTISQPYIVAVMTAHAEVERGDKVLEVGTGSGYQAAVLAEIGAKVYSIEIVEPLGKQAAHTLTDLGYQVKTRIGDGYRGWPEAAPFDAILVTAAPPEVPEPLKQQLAVGGKMVIPVGEVFQELRVITRTKTGFDERRTEAVRFVPMTGEAQKQQPSP